MDCDGFYWLDLVIDFIGIFVLGNWNLIARRFRISRQSSEINLYNLYNIY